MFATLRGLPLCAMLLASALLVRSAAAQAAATPISALFEVDITLSAQGYGHYHLDLGDFTGGLHYSWNNAAKPLRFRPVPTSGPFKAFAKTTLVGSWNGEHAGSVLGMHQGCKIDESSKTLPVRVTLARASASSAVTLTIEPIMDLTGLPPLPEPPPPPGEAGTPQPTFPPKAAMANQTVEGFFEHEDAHCNQGDMQWMIEPERLFRAGEPASGPDAAKELQKFYDTKSFAVFTLLGTSGKIPATQTIVFPKQAIRALGSEVWNDGTVKVSIGTIPMMPLDLPPPKPKR